MPSAYHTGLVICQTVPRYRPLPAVLDTYRRWRLYQAREYYAFALNALWVHLCDFGLEQQGDLRPLPLVTLHDYFTNALDFPRFSRLYDLPTPSLTPASDLLSLLKWLDTLIGAQGVEFDQACTLDKPIHEHHLYQSALDGRGNPSVMITGMVLLLALIIERFAYPQCWMTPEWEISRKGADGRLSVDGFVRRVRHRLQSGGYTIAEFLQWLLDDYVILQHLVTATSKLPENTFRFQREGDRLRFFRLDNSLGFLDSRFDAISTTVHELGLCGDLRQPDHPLTQIGQQLLTTGDLPWTS